MEFTIETLTWIMIVGVTFGIFFGTITSFIRLGFKMWKWIVLIGMIVWIGKSLL
tara:strand:- start:1300 stop:1461 length:162 start_codon:yes stop_codon:yes gene_type:complete